MSTLEEFNRQHAIYQLQFELPALPLQEAIAHALKVLPPADGCDDARVDEAICKQLDELIPRAWVDPPTDDAIKLTAYCMGVLRVCNAWRDRAQWAAVFGRVIDSKHMPALCTLVGMVCDVEMSTRLDQLIQATSHVWQFVVQLVHADGNHTGVDAWVPVHADVKKTRRQTLIAVFAGLSSKHKTVVYKTLCRTSTPAKWELDKWIGSDDARQILSDLATRNDAEFGDGRNLELLEIIQKDNPNADLSDEVRGKLHKKPRAYGERTRESILERSTRSSPAMQAFLRRQLPDVEPDYRVTNWAHRNHRNPISGESHEKVASVSRAVSDALYNAPFGGDPNRTLPRDIADLVAGMRPTSVREKMDAVSQTFSDALQQAPFGRDPNRKLPRDIAERIEKFRSRVDDDLIPGFHLSLSDEDARMLDAQLKWK